MIRVVCTDTEQLDIVNRLKQSHKELSDTVGSVSNIFNVFFHDLVSHFTGIIIQRAAFNTYSDRCYFPYVTKEYALSPTCIDSFSEPRNNVEFSVKNWIKRSSLSRLAIGNSIPFSGRHRRLLSSFISMIGGLQAPTKAYLSIQKEQLDALSDVIEDICNEHQIPKYGTIQRNWMNFSKLHTTLERKTLKQNRIILGTRNDLQNRKLAVNFLQQGKEVVGFTHGEITNAVFDEPPYGYSERSLCSVLVEYGDYDKDGIHNRALIRPGKTLYRSSGVIKSRFTTNESIGRTKLGKARILYIPTTYTGNSVYGPFHVYEDSVYREWHKALMVALPTLTFKAHPKSRGQIGGSARIQRGWLEDCIDHYDVLVVDYLSTASVLSLTTQKPVIFFDIGLRRLSEEFMEDVGRRCKYVKIDINGDLLGQVKECLDEYESETNEWSNREMAKYSICLEDSFNWVDLLGKEHL